MQASPGDPHRGFFIGTQEGPGAVLDGFTIVNGYMGSLPGASRTAPATAGAADDRHDLSAGGVKCQDAAPTLRNLVIERCGSEFTGGGMSIELLASPTVENCVLRGCYADYGGGLSIETVSTPTLVDCVVTGNRARRGGGIFLQALGTLEGCVVSGNQALEYGGALLAVFPASPSLRRTTVWGNCAGAGGDEVSIDQAATLTFACSNVDSMGISRADATSILVWQGANVFTAPNFCFPLPCATAPTTGGGYICRRGRPAWRPAARAASGSGPSTPRVAARLRCGRRPGPASNRGIAPRTPPLDSLALSG